MFTMLDTSPESLKKLSDYINKLYNLAYDQNGSALRTDSIKRKNIIAKAIGTTEVDDGAITATQIAASAVTAEKILAGSITAEHIAAKLLSGVGIKTIKPAGDGYLLLKDNHLEFYNTSDALVGYFGATQAGLSFSGGISFESGADISMYSLLQAHAGISANTISTTGTLPLQITQNTIDSTVSSNLWLNYYSGSNVKIGNGTSGGYGDLYCANLYASSAVYVGGTELTVP